MYEDFFGLRKSAFSMMPDPGTVFMTAAHREALSGLYYAVVRRKGFVALTGEAGTGKTTLIRKLLELVQSDVKVAVVFNPTLTAAEFLEYLLIRFGVEDIPTSKARRLALLEQVLHEAHRIGRTPLLVIDEAHKLTPALLEEIRLLTNFETKDQKLLHILLAGQPELNETLNQPGLWQLKQRIAIRLTLSTLGSQQIDEYLSFRWRSAGGALPHPFDRAATELIADLSQGIPRLINSIADQALMLAFSARGRSVHSQHIRDVAIDLDLKTQAQAAEAQAFSWVVNKAGCEQPATVQTEQPVVNAAAPPTFGSYSTGKRSFFFKGWASKLKAKSAT